MRFINDLKNVKKNWKTIQASPYGSLVFRYRTTLITIVLFSLFMAFTIIKIVLNNSSPGIMGLITKIFTICIGVLIISKGFAQLKPIKRAMAPYEKNKELINHTTDDAKVEISNILDQFDDDGKRRDDIHLEKNELNSKKEVAPVLPR